MKNLRTIWSIVACAALLVACSGDATSEQATDASTTTSAAITESTAGAGEQARLDTAESMIDAFYAFDAATLAELLGDSVDANSTLDYQGWARGANYEIVERMPCEPVGAAVTCSITVRDDLIEALGLDFNVTDTFLIGFDEPTKIRTAITSADDPPIVGEAFGWIRTHKPELGDGESL